MTYPLTTTLNRIWACNPCDEGQQRALEAAGKDAPDDEPISYADIAEAVGLDDALWCCRAEPQHSREWQLFAVWCVRQVQHLMNDERSIHALDVAGRYANGNAAEEELAAASEAAWVAAWEAAWEAREAREAAWEAAWEAREAARAAAWEAARAAAGEASEAAWVAARAAAWEAARAAAREAAWEAAREAREAAGAAAGAAREAAWVAARVARAAAWEAARVAQKAAFIHLVTTGMLP